MGCFGGWGVEGLGCGLLLGKVIHVPGKGLRIIRNWVENPSGVFSTKFLRLMSLVTSVLANEVGGSGFMVKVSGAPKFKGLDWVFEGKNGNLVSIKRQLTNLAL